MSDASTIASPATVGGALVLAVAAAFPATSPDNRSLRACRDGGVEPWSWMRGSASHWNRDRAAPRERG